MMGFVRPQQGGKILVKEAQKAYKVEGEASVKRDGREKSEVIKIPSSILHVQCN